MTSYVKSVEAKVRERFESESDNIGVLVSQVIVNENGKHFFYKSEGINYTKHSNPNAKESDFKELLKSGSRELLLKLEKKINENKVIFVENDGKPRLISTNDIHEVQLLFE